MQTSSKAKTTNIALLYLVLGSLVLGFLTGISFSNAQILLGFLTVIAATITTFAAIRIFNRVTATLPQQTTHTDTDRTSFHANDSLVGSPQPSKSEQAYRESQARLDEVQQIAQLGSWELNIVKNELKWSAEIFRMFEIDPNKFGASYEAFLNAIHPDDRDRVNEAYTNSLKTKQPYEITHRLLLPNGSIKYVTERCVSTFDKDGKAIRSVGTVQNVTSRIIAEMQAQRISRLLQSVLDSSQDWIYAKDLSYRFVLANQSFATACARKPETIIGSKDIDIWPRERCEGNPAKNIRGYREDDRLAFAGQTIHNPRDEIILANGDHRIFETYKGPLRDHDNTIVGVFTYSRDVTERLATEAKLKMLNESLERRVKERTNELDEQRNFISTILQTAAALIIVLDRKGNFVRYNKTCERITGYRADEVIGEPIWKRHLPDEQREEVKSIFSDIAINPIPEHYETYWTSKEGHKRLIAWSNSTITDENDTVCYVIGTGIDITEQKTAEEQLRRSETNLRTSQRIAKIGGWEWEIDTGRLWWSDEIYRIFGRDSNSYQPTYEKFLQSIHPDDRSNVIDSINDSFEHRRYETQHRIILPDNSIRFVHERGEVSYDAEGKPVTMSGTAQDITELRHAENERDQLQRQLLQSQKMEAIGQLTGGIAHDFNNILAAILGYTELAKRKFANDAEGKLAQYLTQIEKSSKRARDLVSQMLTFSRNNSITLTLIDPTPILKESIRMLRPTIAASININVNTDPNVSFIEADPIQFQQSIINLVINSRDAINKHGTITVKLKKSTIDHRECSSCHETFSGDFVEVSVRDNGRGIAQQALSRIFEPFFTTKEIGKGSGMGLSIVHGIVHGSHGHISVESENGQGTTISVYFPKKESTINSSTFVETDFPPIEKSDRKIRILVVDDETDVSDYLTELLDMNHYETTECTSSIDALDIFMKDNANFDLVITDQTMPGMTGIELIEKIHERSPSTPVILCSGYNEHVNEPIASRHGVNRFLSKPIDSALLLKAIAETTRHAKAQNAAVHHDGKKSRG